jgi:hypothetical protein
MSQKITIKMKKGWLAAFLAALIYRIFLDLAYYLSIARVWASEGFILNPNPIKATESYLLFFVIFLLMPKGTQKISEIIIWLLVLFSYVPLLTLYALAEGPRLLIYGVTLFWILVFALSLAVPISKITFIKKNQGTGLYTFFFVAFATAIIFLIFKYGAFTFNFDLNKVYEIRRIFVGLDIPFSNYLFNWVALILNPFFFVAFLRKKRWLLLVLSAFFQMALFSITGNKVYLFAIPFVLFIVWLIKTKRPLFSASIGISAIIIIGLVASFFGNNWFSNLFANRTLLVPALVTFDYYDFFSKNDLVYLSSNRIFNDFLVYPYNLDPPHLIGSVYFGNPIMNVNCGIVADAYMNFGLPGFVILAFLLVILLKIADSFSNNKNIEMVIAAFGMSVIFFTNIPFLTLFLTDGMLLGLLILYLLPREDEKNLHCHN